MQRRDFVKAMVAASMTARAALAQQAAPAASPIPHQAPIPPGPVPWSEGLGEVRPLPVMPLVPDAVAQTHTYFFSRQQMATLRRLSQVLMPPLNGNPGANEAGTPEFLDFLIGSSLADRQQIYQSGLDHLEAEARRKFGVAFAVVSAAQADELIRPGLRTWMSDHPPTGGFAEFINLAHSEIRMATHNSQAWCDAAIAAGRPAPSLDVYWYPVDPDLSRDRKGPAHRPVAAGQQS